MVDDCNVCSKEMDRIETLVGEAKQATYSMCGEFKDIMASKIYCPVVQNDKNDTPGEPVPANKLDRIMLDLHRIINTLRDFKKKELAELETELSKL
jgi:hypothetical protein